MLLFLCENSVVRADRLWRGGGTVRRHRLDVVRRRHLANLASNLEPAFWNGHRRVPHDRSNFRWAWDPDPKDCSFRIDHSCHRVFAFLPGLHPWNRCRADHLFALRELLRTILLPQWGGCSLRCDGNKCSSGNNIRPNGAPWTRSLRDFIYFKSDILPFYDSGLGSKVASSKSNFLGDTHHDRICTRGDFHSQQSPGAACDSPDDPDAGALWCVGLDSQSCRSPGSSWKLVGIRIDVTHYRGRMGRVRFEVVLI
jgi:hypothetical protein